MDLKPPAHLRADTIWQLKPWWCQPWSILLTGLIVVALSWFWLQQWWLTAMVAAAVLTWWLLFLVLVPRAWSQAMASGQFKQSAGAAPGESLRDRTG